MPGTGYLAKADRDGKVITVAFGGVLATTPKRLDDHTIEAVVPDAAASGEVVVTAGGIASAASPT